MKEFNRAIDQLLNKKYRLEILKVRFNILDKVS